MVSRKNKPNILLMVVDCLRADRCPTDKNKKLLPAWNHLRRHGTCFTQMISSASFTPVCFASLLSGTYPFRHGVSQLNSKGINQDIFTFPMILKNHSYNTYAYVTGPLIELYGLNQGFDVYQCRPREITIYDDWGVQLLNQFNEGYFQQPWFILLHLFELHRPRKVNNIEVVYKSEAEYNIAWQQLNLKIQDLMARLPENTIVILTADHGEAIHRRSDRTLLGHITRKVRENLNLPPRPIDHRGHGFFLFEELVRIPCSLTGPQIPSQTTLGNQVRQIDLMPTILNLIDIDIPPALHGRSLVPLLHGECLPDCPAYIESGANQWHGLRSEDWKYVEFSEENSGNEILFNLQHDPGENRNVIKKHPQIADAMRRQIKQLFEDEKKLSHVQARAFTAEEKQRLEDQLRSLGYL